MGVKEACSRFIGDILQGFRCSSQPISSSPHHHFDHIHHSSSSRKKPQNTLLKVDHKMVSALITLFGMETNGRIKKENASRVVEKLGLIHSTSKDQGKSSSLELPYEDDEVPVEEVLDGLEDMSKCNELLLRSLQNL